MLQKQQHTQKILVFIRVQVIYECVGVIIIQFPVRHYEKWNEMKRIYFQATYFGKMQHILLSLLSFRPCVAIIWVLVDLLLSNEFRFVLLHIKSFFPGLLHLNELPRPNGSASCPYLLISLISYKKLDNRSDPFICGNDEFDLSESPHMRVVQIFSYRLATHCR